MLKTFKRQISTARSGISRVQVYLIAVAFGLLAVNCLALFLCVNPPGGSKRDLLERQQSLRKLVRVTHAQLGRLQTVSSRVRTGSAEVAQFGSSYVLSQRSAYSQVLDEIARMAKDAHLQERDAVFNEEPIEGTPNLALLNMTANYQGTYASFQRFLYEVDLSPMLLILDNLQASPQDKPGQINTSIRFQAIVREAASEGEATP